MKDLISICVPTYNGEKYLLACLDSIQNQTYDKFEILIVDDRSSDETLNLANDLGKKDSRIRIIQNDKNLGLVPNWNKCIREAEGKWIKFLFQDDLMHKDCCTTLMDFANDHNVRVVLSDRSYFINNINEEAGGYYSSLKRMGHYISDSKVVGTDEISKIYANDFLGSNFIGEPIVGIIRREVFDEYGLFHQQLKQIADFEFWLRIATNEPIGFVNQPLNYFRVHDKSTSFKNAQKSKVNVSWIDRVELGLMIKHDPHYKKFREYLSGLNVSLDVLLKDKYTHYIREMGYFRSLKYTERKASRYFRFSFKNFAKAIQSDLNG